MALNSYFNGGKKVFAWGERKGRGARKFRTLLVA